MAKLPQQGVYVNPDGTIAWVWTLAEPHQELDYLPPRRRIEDGSFVYDADPAGYILDLTTLVAPEDMPMVHEDLPNVRVRTDAQGKPQLKKVLRDKQGNAVTEIDHPAVIQTAARKAATKGGKA
jgi:hypothetical protein